MTVNLGKFLNKLEKKYHKLQFLSSDPLEFVHRYSDPMDQEVVALLAALLAYGNVKQIRKSVEEALRRIAILTHSDHPREFVEHLSNSKFKRKALDIFETYVHRFNSGTDLISLLSLLNKSWDQYGSLGAHFLKYHLHDADTIEIALIALLKDWNNWLEPSEHTAGLRFLISSPEKGSCCKRWCMFLRWMGRSDDLDVGLWHSKGLQPKHLVMPLDTHTGRISQYLGLTSKKNLGWKTALEVTESLRKINPDDPTRYDFAMARLGILDLCQRRYRKEICQNCDLLPVCRFAQSNSKTIKN